MQYSRKYLDFILQSDVSPIQHVYRCFCVINIYCATFSLFQPAARKRTSSSSGLKYKNRTQSRQTLSRALTTSCAKQGRVNNNRVPKRLKSQSKPSLSKVQLRSRRRGAEPKALAKGETCQLGLRDSKVSLCKSVTVKKEKDGQELVQQTLGQRGCLTRHAA